MLKFADLLDHSTVLTVYEASEFNCFIVLKFASLDFENCFAYEIVPIRDMRSVFLQIHTGNSLKCSHDKR